MVPPRTGNQGKPGKWEGIFQSGKSQGILSRLEKSGNFTQNTGKIGKNYTGKLKRILEKVREICQPVIVKTLQIWYHTLNKKRTLKNTGKLPKILESQGNLSVRKSGNHNQAFVRWHITKKCTV